MKELTIQQKKVLQCIKFYIKKTGFPPTRADICRELGFKSPNAAESHLRALEKKGYITIENGASRGINLTENTAEKSQTIPVIGLVAAGSPTLADENIEKHIPYQESLFLSDFDYFLRVKGLSMKDAGIMEDDLVAIKKTSEVRNGDIVVARIDDEVKELLPEKHHYLIDGPDNDLDGSPLVIRYNKNLDIHYLSAEKDGKRTGNNYFFEEGSWQRKEK